MSDSSKLKKKNSDKRKEKSRFAARDRRGREADIFSDLQMVIPVVPEPTVTHVDRIAMLRLAASLCRIRQFVPYLIEKEPNLESSGGENHIWTEETMHQCLDGFILICNEMGVIVYISQGVSQYLGLTQTDLVGRDLKDFIHQEDFNELQAFRNATDPVNEHVVLRMKTVISPRGRNLNLKAASFKPFTFSLRTINCGQTSTGGTTGGRLYLLHAFGTGSNMTLAETAAGTFMSRHTADMKFSYCNDGASLFLGYDAKSLMGQSFYELIHPGDLKTVTAKLKELFKKGHCSTDYYRLLNLSGDAVWVQTDATTVTHTTRGQRGLYVVCRHQVLGDFRSSNSGVSPVTIKIEPADSSSEQKTECRIDSANSAGEKCDFRKRAPFVPSAQVEHAPDLIKPQDKPRQSLLTATTDIRRKRSYEEVLEWLFRGSPDSPPPTLQQRRQGPNTTGRASSAQRNQQQPASFPFIPDSDRSGKGTNILRMASKSTGTLGPNTTFSPLSVNTSETDISSRPTTAAPSPDLCGGYRPQWDERKRSFSGPTTKASSPILPAVGALSLADQHTLSPVGPYENSNRNKIAPMQSPLFATNISTSSSNSNKSPQLSPNHNHTMLMPSDMAEVPSPDATNEMGISLAPFVDQGEMVTLCGLTDVPLEFDDLLGEMSVAELFSNENKADVAIPPNINQVPVTSKQNQFGQQNYDTNNARTPPMISCTDTTGSTSMWSGVPCQTTNTYGHNMVKGIPTTWNDHSFNWASNWNNTQQIKPTWSENSTPQYQPGMASKYRSYTYPPVYYGQQNNSFLSTGSAFMCTRNSTPGMS